jgi:hypothetical protein
MDLMAKLAAGAVGPVDPQEVALVDGVSDERDSFLKKKLPSPKDGWKNGKGATITAFSDKNRLLQHLFDIF